jgi:hypothetical protein
MNKLRIANTILLLLSLLYSCGDDDNSSKAKTCQKACQAVDDCDGLYTFDDCYQVYCADDEVDIVPTSKCISAIANASCAKHDLLGRGSYYDICLPLCGDDETPYCSGDNISLCFTNGYGESRSSKVTCDSICEADDESYTGYCGTVSPTGQKSATGNDVCWCAE